MRLGLGKDPASPLLGKQLSVVSCLSEVSHQRFGFGAAEETRAWVCARAGAPTKPAL